MSFLFTYHITIKTNIYNLNHFQNLTVFSSSKKSYSFKIVFDP